MRLRLKLDRRAALMRKYRLRWWRKQREKFYNLGLRSDGRPRLTDRRPMTATEKLRHRRRICRAIYRRMVARRATQGLTARGTRPIYGQSKKITPIQALYHELTSSITRPQNVEDIVFLRLKVYA